jgi:hypothetical protein
MSAGELIREGSARGCIASIHRTAAPIVGGGSDGGEHVASIGACPE